MLIRQDEVRSFIESNFGVSLLTIWETMASTDQYTLVLPNSSPYSQALSG